MNASDFLERAQHAGSLADWEDSPAFMYLQLEGCTLHSSPPEGMAAMGRAFKESAQTFSTLRQALDLDSFPIAPEVVPSGNRDDPAVRQILSCLGFLAWGIALRAYIWRKHHGWDLYSFFYSTQFPSGFLPSEM
ncbi:hypothetical protein C8Q72DRAFT_794563 [Fomitopsis betulina]|nr:hypothetical protein C8Q72DRAFT_794563 [Fomitopsis betulina]